MAGLRIIETFERFTHRGDGFKIYYRRLPNPTRGKIIERHTKRGSDRVNLALATTEMLEYCILGWDGVYTINEAQERRDIPFSTDKVASLPDEVQADLIDLVGCNIDAGEVEAGNSRSTSGSNPITED